MIIKADTSPKFRTRGLHQSNKHLSIFMGGHSLTHSLAEEEEEEEAEKERKKRKRGMDVGK